MEADECDLAVLKPKFARRGSLRTFSVLGGLALLASPSVDSLMRSEAAKSELSDVPHVVAAEMETPHQQVEWTRMRQSQAKHAPSVESCDHQCRTWERELAAHVSFGY